MVEHRVTADNPSIAPQALKAVLEEVTTVIRGAEYEDTFEDLANARMPGERPASKIQPTQS